MSAKTQSKTPEDSNPPPSTLQSFGADVSRLLNIVANALYTNHDVFLRELISNSADACDRLRYDSISNPALIKDNTEFRIHVFKDTKTRTLSVIDNGIGMNATELAENLGTIAKSGTASLMEKMEASSQGNEKLKLIGQFGVGFYAAYMVGFKIQVISRKAGESDTWHWESDGRTGFIVRPATTEEAEKLDGSRGTVIIIDIKDEACDFLLDEKIEMTVKMYSDHISVPIYLGTLEDTKEEKSKRLNSASALWMRPKADITKEQYTEFYRHLTGGFDEPLMISHWKAEGKYEFTALTFIPTLRPWDLFDPSRRHFVKLYVRRVFISEDVETMMYPWLRFVRGIIDSEDLPLNISRESLQFNPIISKIRSAVAKRILTDLDKISRDDPPAFVAFWGQFGAVIKEGLYDAPEHRTDLLKICRFYSSHHNGEKFTSLAEYAERIKDKQDKIYYISGESLNSIKNSPQLEGFRARGIEVLYFTDTIDDFWLQKVYDYEGKRFQSITKGDIDLSNFESVKSNDENKNTDKTDDSEKSDNDELSALIEKLKDILGKKVNTVRKSQRLTDSPVCLVAAENSADMYMERVLKIHQKYEGESKPVLEINANHPLIKKLATLHQNEQNIEDSAYLLFDQACILQGEPLENPAAFTQRMATAMLKGLIES